MLKNKEIKWLFIVSIIFAFILLCGMLFWNESRYRMYQDTLILNNASIVASILDKHPELEDDLIDCILEKKKLTEKGEIVLAKYGLLEKESYTSLSQLDELHDKMQKDQLWMVLITFIGISFFFLCYIIKEYYKVRQLNQYMNAILNGDYTLDIRDYQEGSMSHLKDDIYKMTVLLKKQSTMAHKDKIALEETLSDISHQIKTPLTSMYMMNEVLKEDDLDPKVKQEFLNKTHKQLERIDWLVSSLLKLSRIESGMVTMKKDTVSIRTLVHLSLEPLRIPIELKKQIIEVDIKEDLSLIGDESWLVEALINIIKNAHEHTEATGKIIISASENPIYKEIKIQDEGCGISKQELPHLFERFYKAKNSKSDSVGIGLHLASKIISSSEGEIVVHSTEGIGTTFFLRFYK